MKTGTPRFSGSMVVEARNRAGITQNELARRANIHASQLSKIETEKNLPGAALLGALAGALGCDVSAFFAEGEEAVAEDDEESDLLDAAHALDRAGDYSLADKLRRRARDIARQQAARQTEASL